MDSIVLGGASIKLPFAAIAPVEIGNWIFAYSALAMVIILVFGFYAKKGIRKNGNWIGMPAKLAEHSYLFCESLAVNMMGTHGKRYVPFLLSIWTFTFVGNALGLLFSQSPCADWSLNIGMALVTIAYVQYEGIRVRGPFGHLRHFAGPKMPGMPVFMAIVIALVLFCAEVISELMKNFSLSIRLYANIHGGHLLVGVLNSLVPFAPVLGGGVFPIEVFDCIIQAFVWTILASVYLMLVTASHEEEDMEAEF